MPLGVGVFPPQDPIQQILPPWIYNDSLVPGKPTSGHLARWAVQGVNIPVLVWPLIDQSLIPLSEESWIFDLLHIYCVLSAFEDTRVLFEHVNKF